MNETDELIHVSVAGEEIVTTPEHPFYVPQKGWTGAISLRAGDVLVLANGEYIIVEKVQHEILESPVKVYNFEVEDYHTYYAGENCVLVHNDCKGNGGPKEQETYPGRKSAFNAAKRELGVPTSSQPTSVGPNIGNRGEINPGRVYYFGANGYIRDDVCGHLFSDGVFVGRHFNISTSKKHFMY